MSAARARQRAERLVKELRISKPFVDVERIARDLGLAVVRGDLGRDVSGILITKGRVSTICIAEAHHEHRQRFTIAHEIAHHVLGHHFHDGSVHVDKVSMRNARSSEGSDPLEIEANQFASTLLMPEALVRESMHALPNIDIEEVVAKLARTFRVSQEAVAFRLATLGYAT